MENTTQILKLKNDIKKAFEIINNNKNTKNFNTTSSFLFSIKNYFEKNKNKLDIKELKTFVYLNLDLVYNNESYFD